MADVKWIKITTDIFDDEKILLIESMPDSDAVIVIWFKLLCLAGKQNNSGVFTMNDKIAYTDEMLATIFRRPISTIRMSLDVFEKFGMINRIDGVITIPNWGKHQNFDKIERNNEYHKEYMREYRQKQKLLAECDVNGEVNRDVNVNALDKNREEKNREDKEKNNKTSVSYYPNDEKLDSAFKEYVAMRKKIKSPMTERAIELAIKKLNTLSNGDNDVAIEILEQSIMNSWKGLFPLKEERGGKPSQGIDWDKV